MFDKPKSKQEKFYIAGIEFTDNGYLNVDIERKLNLVFDTLKTISINATKELGGDVIIFVVLYEYFFTPKSISSKEKKNLIEKISNEIKQYANMVIIPGSFSNYKNGPDSKLSDENLNKKIKSVKNTYQTEDNNNHQHYRGNNILFASHYYNMKLLLEGAHPEKIVFLKNETYAISSSSKVKHNKRFPILENTRLGNPSLAKNYVYTFKQNPLMQNITVNERNLSLLMTICRDHAFINQDDLGRHENPDIHVIVSNIIDVKGDHLLGKINIHMDKSQILSVLIDDPKFNGMVKAALYNIDPENPASKLAENVAIQWYSKYNVRNNSTQVRKLTVTDKSGQLDRLDIDPESHKIALNHAACNGYYNVLKTYLGTNVSTDYPNDSHDQTALFSSCKLGYLNQVRLLLKMKANVNQVIEGDITPLWIAARNGHESIVKLLINEGKADVNLANNDGLTPLWVAAGNGQEAVVKLLINEGKSDVNQADNNGATPLFIAAQNGHKKVVKILLKNCANTKIAFKTTADSLKRFAEKRSKQIKQSMSHFINGRTGHIEMTPLDIAGVMGNDAIENLIKKNMQDNQNLSGNAATLLYRVENIKIETEASSKPENPNCNNRN